MKEQVVPPRDHLTLRTALYPGAMHKAAPNRDVAMPGDERRDQRQQAIQVGREIDVHIGDDRRATPEPRLSDGPASTLLFKAHGADTVQLERQPLGDHPRRIGARVVHDGDPRLKRKLVVEVSPQPANTPLEVAFLVVDRDRDVKERSDYRAGGDDRQNLRHALMVRPQPCRFRD